MNLLKHTSAFKMEQFVRSVEAEINRVLAEKHELEAENTASMTEITRLRAENERLRAALKECEEELDGYYHQDYPTDHPYHQRKLKVALQGNPARAALKENNE